MRPSRRRRSRARPSPATRATTSWAIRWEAERDAQDDQLAQIRRNSARRAPAQHGPPVAEPATARTLIAGGARLGLRFKG